MVTAAQSRQPHKRDRSLQDWLRNDWPALARLSQLPFFIHLPGWGQVAAVRRKSILHGGDGIH